MEIQPSNTSQRRLRILGDGEIETMYGLPHFTDEERLEYFALSPTEKAALEPLHSITSRIYGMLQLGYFKSHHMFFVFHFPEVEEDARYIQKQYFPSFQLTELAITKVTRLKQQRLILELFNYRSCDTAQRQALAIKARQAAMVCGQPLYIFRALMHYLEEQRIVAPGYSFMQDTVGKALTDEQHRLTALVHHHLQEADREALDRLLEDAPGLYEITGCDLRHSQLNGGMRRLLRRRESNVFQLGNGFRLARGPLSWNGGSPQPPSFL